MPTDPHHLYCSTVCAHGVQSVSIKPTISYQGAIEDLVTQQILHLSTVYIEYSLILCISHNHYTSAIYICKAISSFKTVYIHIFYQRASSPQSNIHFARLDSSHIATPYIKPVLSATSPVPEVCIQSQDFVFITFKHDLPIQISPSTSRALPRAMKIENIHVCPHRRERSSCVNHSEIFLLFKKIIKCRNVRCVCSEVQGAGEKNFCRFIPRHPSLCSALMKISQKASVVCFSLFLIKGLNPRGGDI